MTHEHDDNEHEAAPGDGAAEPEPGAGASRAGNQTGTVERVSRRRGLLLAGTGLTGLLVGAGATEGANLATAPGQAMEPVSEIPPSEDLMREHGVLKRVLLVYRHVTDQLRAGGDVPAEALHQAATVVHQFVEGFHEGLEEAYVFPRLKRANQHVATVNTLLVQHARGRRITQHVLGQATNRGLNDPGTRGHIVDELTAFVYMYEPHEAREDTVIFPTFRAITPAQTFANLGEHFADLEHQRFGTHGFTDIVTRVAEIERRFGLDDLTQYTPR